MDELIRHYTQRNLPVHLPAVAKSSLLAGLRRATMLSALSRFFLGVEESSPALVEAAHAWGIKNVTHKA